MLHYFAYGSCMDEHSFKGTVGAGNYSVLGVASLPDYRLAFTLYSEHRQGGVADIVAAKGERVEGVLYLLHPDALPDLDKREGVDIGHYRRIRVKVWHQGSLVEAETYTVVNKASEEIKPSEAYLKLIYNGAVGQLSPAYRRRLAEQWNKRFGVRSFL
ncbi:gamma-glutamylcyclotransferase family protein [Laceyella putida]|uniref:Gamma-glutamylcyclotransferase family protein n=1 Tax=Laceyella putida TaxID=110101 RepID=A0ABW2RK58_9BACL